MKNTNRVVITGGSGFIGSSVAELFIKNGYTVVILDRKPSIIPQAKWYRVNLEKDNLSEYLSEGDIVFHFAACANATEVSQKPLESLNDNLLALGNVLYHGSQKKIAKVVFSSTFWVSEGCLDGSETGLIYPGGTKTLYANEKIAGEMLVSAWKHEFNLDYVIFRLGNPVGPRMWNGLVVDRFLRKLHNDEDIELFGDGSQKRAFLYVGDIAQACLNLYLNVNYVSNEIINLSGTSEVTIKELVYKLAALLDKQPKIIIKDKRKTDVIPKKIPIEKAKHLLQWEPMGIDEALAKTVAYYNEKIFDAEHEKTTN